MIKYQKVMFVSESGTTEAPLAAEIFNRDIPEKQYQAEARGLVVLFPEPANPKIVAIAKSRGIDLENFKARELMESDFGADTLVLVMTEKQKIRVYSDYKEAINVFSMTEFAEEAGEVHNPYGDDLQGYGAFFESMEVLVQKIIYKLYKEEDR